MDATREKRARRAAIRQGFQLHKSKQRDPRAIGFGLWAIAHPDGSIVEGGYVGLSLDAVERFLTS